MALGKSLRMRRLRPRGRTVIVALDHGAKGGPLPGLENPLEIVKASAGAGADGVIVTPGVLEQVADEIGALAVLLRIDGAVSELGPGGPLRLICDPADALAMGADAVVVSATLGSAYESAELEKVGRIASEGRRWGLPLLAQMSTEQLLAGGGDDEDESEPISVAGIAKDVEMACRIGVELGADAISTRFCGDIQRFRRIVAPISRPVLVTGGSLGEADLSDILEVVDQTLEAGAAGVVFGRSVWQYPDPSEAIRAICAMVHDDATVEEALDAVAV